MKHEAALKEIIRTDRRLMKILPAVRELRLSNWYVAGGAIRNTVWDKLHGKETPFNDIDVVYHDASDLTKGAEQSYDRHLKIALPQYTFESINQARVHLWSIMKGMHPLLSTEAGIASWTENVTCVGARLEEDDSITICAPHGLNDLFALRVRPGPLRNDLELYARRISKKRWLAIWPKLKIFYV